MIKIQNFVVQLKMLEGKRKNFKIEKSEKN